MEQTLKLDIPILLPGVADERDQCVVRLQQMVEGQRGIHKAHVEQAAGKPVFCLHFDPNLMSLAAVKRLASDAGAEVSRRFRHDTMKITGMDCTNCAASIEGVLRRTPGVLNVAVNYAAEKLTIEYDTEIVERDSIIKRTKSLGYTLDAPPRTETPNWVRDNWELVLSLLSGLFLALGFFGATVFNLPTSVALGLYILAYLAGGFDAARHAFKAAIHLQFDIDVLMVVAAIGAAALGEWAEGALLLFLFSLGHALEHYAMGRARRAIEALGQLTPKTARIRRAGVEAELAVEDIQRGDIAIIRPGERIPVDGTVLIGQSTVDQSSITGESIPVTKEPSMSVFAGTINGEGALEVTVTKLAQDSTIARITAMVEEAQTQKSPTQRFTERFERVFVPAVLASVVLVIVVPPLVGWLPWNTAFLRAMTMLIAASPCALAIATPAAVLSGIGQAARHGVLIKGGVHLENLGTLQALALDKTGTITEGTPVVTDIIPLSGMPEVEVLRLTAAVESRSGHPLAQAVVRAASAQNLHLPTTGELQSITGRGVRATVDGQVVRVGSTKLYTEETGQSLADNVRTQVQALEAAGKTTMIVSTDTTVIGILALADQPRASAAATLTALKGLGIKALVMLTGDNARVAATIAHTVGLTDVKADLLPEDKVSTIKALLGQHGKVAMIGDGVNDAPALAHATVGIAMGAGGSDVALETADVALMSDDISKLPFAVALSRQSRRIILQNVGLSLGVIALLLPSAVFGVAGIGIAIILHEGSTLLVVANALRLLRFTRHLDLAKGASHATR